MDHTIETLKFRVEQEQVTDRSLTGQYLVAEELSVTLKNRYNKLPEKIYIRKCYIILYDSLSEKLLSGEMDLGTALFTGVPGIGKSIFLIYFLYRFLNDERFSDKSFILELCDDRTCEFYKPSNKANQFICTVEDVKHFKTPKFFVFSDIKAPKEPVVVSKCTLIFCSPDPRRYKERMKFEPYMKYTMNTWSQDELMCINSNVDWWYNNFVIFGGVPRQVMKTKDNSNLILAIAEKGPIIAEKFFRFGHGCADADQSYLLIHINPPPADEDDDSDFIYDGMIMYSFASDFIFQELAMKHNSQILAGAIGVFNNGVASETYGAVSAGKLFEKTCLWLCPLDSKVFIANPLTENELPVRFTIPDTNQRELLSHDWKRTAALTHGRFYVPRISNLESGDCFYLIKINQHEYHLVVLQITVGKEHPIKVNGLHDILLAYSQNIRRKIKHKAIVFIIPKHGVLDQEQTLTTKKERPITNIPNIAQGFKQYVFRYELS